jgi:hypothetical protein
MPYRTCPENKGAGCRSAMSGGPDTESIDAGFVEGYAWLRGISRVR